MTRTPIVVAALVLASMGLLIAQGNKAEALLGQGLHQEEVDGNCREAIKTYQKVISQKDAPRGVAGRAQLHVGICQEQLGQREARAAYELLLTRYSDQAGLVAEAHSRLAALGAPALAGTSALVTRPVLAGEDLDPLSASISLDGRYFAYLKWEESGGVLVVRDLTTGAIRRLTERNGPKENLHSPVISPDGKQLAYQWCGARCELRLISLQGSGIPRFRALYTGRWADAQSWTPDGKAVVVYRTFDDRTGDIALISTADGSAHVLKQNPGQYSRMFVSPDGKSLALDHPANGNDGQWDVYILPLDGGPELRVVDHPAGDKLVGWSADGRYLLFTSNRGTGIPGLFALTLANGRPDGTAPLLLYPGVGSALSLGVTKSGALYYSQTGKGTGAFKEIQVAAFDFASQTLGTPVTVGTDRIGSNDSPAWSPDGQHLAYVSSPGRGAGRPALVIRDLNSGVSRELRPELNALDSPKWAPNRQLLATGGLSADGAQTGIFLIDAQTGETTFVASGAQPAWSPDGHSIFLRRAVPSDKGPGFAYIERDLASGTEREIIRRPHLGPLSLSPDGRYIATGINDPADARTLVIIPTSGGEPRILQVNRPRKGGTGLWAPDSRSLMVLSSPEDRRWMTIDGQPSTGPDMNRLPGGWSLSPDGKRLAFVRTTTPTQPKEEGIWVLENFLPHAVNSGK